MTQLHGHEVMRMMLASGKKYSRETLMQEIAENFGKETTFYTCSAKDLSASELIDFLAAKGKFTLHEDGFDLQPEEICDHD